ncbi:MAG: hypothetical protein AAB602_02955 [Patescibacteria group bacterium]
MTGILRLILILALFSGIVGAQFLYDVGKMKIPNTNFAISPKLLKSVDAGLHSMLASYLWLFKTRTELIQFLFLPKDRQEEGFKHLSRNINLINTIDPRYSVPYAYSVIVLPASTYAGRVQAAIDIGTKGIAQADPDWQIPFYLAVTYHLDLKDKINAAKYFDIAGHTPGIPETIRIFSISYGSIPTVREQTKQIWKAIYDTTDDPATKERAQAYIIHLSILDYLEAAAKKYKERYGEYPADANNLVLKKIIPEIPRDPFGFEFKLTNGEARVKE